MVPATHIKSIVANILYRCQCYKLNKNIWKWLWNLPNLYQVDIHRDFEGSSTKIFNLCRLLPFYTLYSLANIDSFDTEF